MITCSGRPLAVAIDDPTKAGEARRAAMALADRLGFSETEAGKVAIVATESATNLSKHARGGEILVQGLDRGSVSGVDILSLDRGPGMADVVRCQADGYSTAGSRGAGLGAMARLSDQFDLHSTPGVGTAALARLWAEKRPRRASNSDLDYGAACVPLAGEEVCGDAWAIHEEDDRILVLVVDGLGHGQQAAEAAREAILVFREACTIAPVEIIQASHAALRSTRGAAMAVARIDAGRGELQFAGVGNISGVILNAIDPAIRSSMISHNGTVGHTVRKIQEFRYSWAPGSLLVMHSDGLGTHWHLGRYPGLGTRHPGLIAGVLYRDFRRARDDVTIVVARTHGESPP